MEKGRIQGLATPGPGGCVRRFQSHWHPTLSKVKSKTGVEGRQGSRRKNGLDPCYCSDQVRKKGDHLYKWALRMVEGCMHGATPADKFSQVSALICILSQATM